MPAADPSLLARGGPILWVLFALGAFALAIFAERLLYLHRGQIRAREFLDGIKNILGRRRLAEAVTVCEETPGPVAIVVKAALLHSEDDEVRMRYAVQDAAIVALPALERRLGALTAIAHVTPLVGLLGTVLGMAGTFSAFMQGESYATPQALAGGMWQALITAGTALALAIPTHLGQHLLQGRIRAIVRDVEWAGNEIMRHLLVNNRASPDTPAKSAP